MRGIIFKTVKEGFRRLHKAHRAEVRRNKKTKGATPVIPMSLKKQILKERYEELNLLELLNLKLNLVLKEELELV